MRVMVVEDAAEQRESWEDLLRLAGHEAEGAANGHAALSRMRVRVPDVLLVDVRMPGMSGPELLRAVAAEPAFAGVRGVMLTGLDDDAVDVLKRQFPGVLVVRKPADPQAVLNLLATFAAAPAAGREGR